MSSWRTRLLQGCMLYAALVLHVADVSSTGPQWVLVVLCWWLGRQTGRHMVQWAMLCGFALDLAGHQQLGLHLAICGGLAACLSLVIAPHLFRNSIALPVIAVWFAGMQTLLSESVIGLLNAGEVLPLKTMLADAALRGLMTGAVVLSLVIWQVVMQRLFDNSQTTATVTLENQWLRLSEG